MSSEFEQRIIYFSGYQGNSSYVFQLIKEYFDLDCVHYSPELSFEKDFNAINELTTNKRIYLIAHSTGCLPALYLHFKFHYPLVLINPSYYPEVTYRDSLSKENQIYISILKSRIRKLKKDCRINLFQVMDDEVVDSEIFLEEFLGNIKYLNRSLRGGHAYNCLIDNLENIKISLFRDELTEQEIEQIKDRELSDALAPYPHYILNILNSKKLRNSFDKVCDSKYDYYFDD